MNELYEAVERNEISKVDVSIASDHYQQYTATYNDGQTRTYFVPKDSAKDLMNRLVEVGVPVVVATSTSWLRIVEVAMPIVPLILVIGYFVYSAKSQLDKTRVKATNGKGKLSSITFQDVGGCDEAKKELQETVAHLKNPARLRRLGGKPPKGVLLVGPPGSGKTLLARAVAGEAGVPFFSLSGSAFTEKFVGVGAARVRELFDEAKKQTPAIVFIDEIDAVGQMRNEDGSGGNQEREQTLNQLLVEMDGFEGDTDIVVLAATNRPEILDDALSRPGRFDRTVTVALPDVRDRQSILETTVQRRDAPLGPEVDLALVARSTPGFSGADLANLVNEAALHAARLERKALQPDDFEAARDRVIMGLENERVMSEAERKVIAIHESGHALIAHYLPDSDPIYKVTIISRGDAMGMLTRLPEADRFTVSRKRLIADMAVTLGGRLAEEKTCDLDDVTSGAANDLERATHIARRMVTEWGFLARGDKRIGYQVYGDSDWSLSETQFEHIEAEIAALIEEARTLADQLLKQHLKELHLLAEELLKRETLTREDIQSLLPLN